jgi:argininosuccinate lyase
MTQPLWQKSDTQVDARIMRFLAGNDVVLDREFFLHDITASKAHVEGLANIGVVSTQERDALLRELDVLAADFSAGTFVLDERFEDGHSAIEARLTERLGDAGRRVHTGRSRNDQVLVATRLWLKEKLATLEALCRRVADVCLERAAGESLPMPGYTHIQRAVVSSTGMWFAAFAEAFIDNTLRARQALELIDANPLGTAAGYGVNIALDRAHTTAASGGCRSRRSMRSCLAGNSRWPRSTPSVPRCSIRVASRGISRSSPPRNSIS